MPGIANGCELHWPQLRERLRDLFSRNVGRKRIGRHDLPFARPRTRRRLRREGNRRRARRGTTPREARLVRGIGRIGERQIIRRRDERRRIAMEKLVADEIAVDAVGRIGERPVDDACRNTVTAQQLPDRPRADGIGCTAFLLYQSETHKRLREAKVRKQIQRLIRSRHDVPCGRIDAGLVRQLPGGDGGPHWSRLRRAEASRGASPRRCRADGRSVETARRQRWGR